MSLKAHEVVTLEDAIGRARGLHFDFQRGRGNPYMGRCACGREFSGPGPENQLEKHINDWIAIHVRRWLVDHPEALGGEVTDAEHR